MLGHIGTVSHVNNSSPQFRKKIPFPNILIKLKCRFLRRHVFPTRNNLADCEVNRFGSVQWSCFNALTIVSLVIVRSSRSTLCQIVKAVDHLRLDYETHVLCLRGACGLRHCDDNRTCMQVCKRSAAAACPAPSRGDGRSGLFLSEQMLFANAPLLPDSTYVRLFHSERWGFLHSRYLLLGVRLNGQCLLVRHCPFEAERSKRGASCHRQVQKHH